jgi:AcrR family transcriptional regulator
MPRLRAKRRAETQRTIQAHAVRLFTERGYDATTVTDVAEAAGVSPMTVYRHFPTKEDLVLVDQRDRLVAERIAASSAAQPWSAVSAPRSSTWPRR